MKKFLVLGASILALSLSAVGPARADGSYDWSGSYFGIKGGGAFDGTTVNSAGGLTSGDFAVDGFIIGAMSGYSLQYGNLVFGIDSDISFADIDGTSSAPACITTCTTEIEYLSTTRGRIGYAMDRFLPYATGGLATGLVDGTIAGVNGKSKFHIGYALGGGVEWAFMEGWFARVEYLFVDLGSKNHSFGGTRVNVDVKEMHVVRAGVSMDTDWIWDSILGR